MPFEKGYAVIIGVGTYKANPAIKNVPITVADAQALSEVLADSQYCAYPKDNITLITQAAATREGILSALDALAANTNEHDTVLLFYAGHGDYDEAGEFCLVPHDAQIVGSKIKTGTGISEPELLIKLNAITSRRVLFIFNACHSGDLQPQALGGNGLDEGPVGGKPLPEKTANNFIATGKGRVILSACGGEAQYSWFVPSEKLTIFGDALVRALKAEADCENGTISLFSLYEYVFDRVVAQAERIQRTQEPELTILKGIGRFTVAMCRGAKVSGAKSLGDADDDPDDPAELPRGRVNEVSAAKNASAVKRVNQIIKNSGILLNNSVNVGDVTQTVNNDNSRNKRVDKSRNRVDTGGGSYTGGDLNVSGNFTGRDRNTTTNIYGEASYERLLQVLQAARIQIDASPASADDKTAAKADLAAAEAEARKPQPRAAVIESKIASARGYIADVIKIGGAAAGLGATLQGAITMLRQLTGG